jgi:DNA-nicking Smr family endonuclease
MAMASKKKTELDDAALLEMAFQDVAPLVGKKIGKAAKAPPKPKAKISKPVQKPPPARGEKPKPKPLPELDHGTAPGVDKRTAQRLKRGRLDVEARLDLHGHTQAEAHPALGSFLAGAQSSGKRCVLIVTGKGGARQTDIETGLERPTGVLKDMVPRWLNQAPNRARILSFTHARPADGGSGALYVLLKRGAAR